MNNLKKILKIYPGISGYLIVIALFNIFLLFLPLFNVFGFEFAFANSILLVFVSGIYLIRNFRKFENDSEIKLDLKNLILPFLIFLVIPPAISIFHSFFTIFCSVKYGILFYLVITFPAIVVGSGIAIFSVLLFKRFRIIIFFFSLIILLLIPLFEFYFNPQVYFFNPIFAYFPGTIYDEGIKITSKLVLYRVFNLFFFSSIFFLCYYSIIGKIKISKGIFVLLIICVSAVFIYISPLLGFSSTSTRLQSELSKKIETEHFIIYTDSKIEENIAKIIALDHEFYFKQLSVFFNDHPDQKIISYVFPSREEKGNLFGSANADVAKPWLGQVFVSLDSYQETLKHEIAHVFSAKFGTGIFEVADKLNPALIEGIAVAADPVYDGNTIDYMAALAYQNGYKINLNYIFKGLNFFGKVSSISYIYAGSFSKYLINRFGIEKFKKFYSDMDFYNIYGSKLESVSQDYYKFLQSFDLSNNKSKANYYFGRQTIFQKICPRYIADRLEDGYEFYSENKYEVAENIFREILKTAPVYSAYIGLSSSLKEQNNITAAIDILKNSLDKFTNTAYYYNIQFRLADLYGLLGKKEEADSLYNNLVNENPNRNLFTIAKFREDLIKSNFSLADYLSGTNDEKFGILKKMNSENYMYSSLLYYFNLADITGRNYTQFISGFENFTVNSFESSYAMLSLSKFMTKNLDFINARKMAALALRFKGDKNFCSIVKDNFVKCNWFYYNAERIITNLKINNPGK